jgi:hypothetical protein
VRDKNAAVSAFRMWGFMMLQIIKGEKMITLVVGAERREEACNPPLINASNAFAFISDGP